MDWTNRGNGVVPAVGSEPANGSPAFVEGVSSAMQVLQRVVADISPTDIPVLLVGESGTGKEVLAVEIHRRSRRRNEPFTKRRCATLAAEFLNGSLPGSEDGGNGWKSRGTVFLDEISELDLAFQPKLLQALPDGDAVPEDGHRAMLGARVICATSRNLEEEMRAGRFREELYYRINGVCLRLPPLRHRKEDIPALVEFFLTKYASLFGRPLVSLRAQTVATLQGYSWPGNIRELENVVKKIVALGDERVALEDLGSNRGEARPNGAGEGISLKEAARAASRHAERELILKVLAKTRWNRKRAAQELQISYKALLYKLKQIGLDETAAT